MHLNQYRVDFDAQLSIFGVHCQSAVNVLNRVTGKHIVEFKLFDKRAADLYRTDCEFVFAAFEPVKHFFVRVHVRNFVVQTEPRHVVQRGNAPPVKFRDGRNIFAPVNDILLFGRGQRGDNRGIVDNQVAFHVHDYIRAAAEKNTVGVVPINQRQVKIHLQAIGDFVHQFNVVTLIISVFVDVGIRRVINVGDDVQSFVEVVERVNFDFGCLTKNPRQVHVNSREDRDENYRQQDSYRDQRIFSAEEFFRSLRVHECIPFKPVTYKILSRIFYRSFLKRAS